MMSTPSWRKIHYGLRAAKNVERKLMAEGLMRLDRLQPLNQYRYIGMGSLYFADFSLFHRRLGVTVMHSIEDTEDLTIRERFTANRPFDTLLHFENTSKALPQLLKPGEAPAIVWLDFDDPLTSDVLADVALVLSSATTPSILAVSVNVEPGDEKGRYARLAEAVGDDLVPEGVTHDAHLGGDKMRAAAYSILAGRIEVSIRARNASLSDPSQRVAFQQLFHFAYADGARMLTVGGVIFSSAQAELLRQCAFGTLPYYRAEADPFRINVPALTTRETLALDAKLPSGSVPTLPGVPASDCEAYSQLYRFLPSFVDAEL